MILILLVKAAIALCRGPIFSFCPISLRATFFWTNFGSILDQGTQATSALSSLLTTKEAAFSRLQVTVYHIVN